MKELLNDNNWTFSNEMMKEFSLERSFKKDMALSFQVPAAKHLKSGFGNEPERWHNVTQKQALHQKTPHRYQQSPVFSRKVDSSSSGQSPNHSRHRHHSAHHNNRSKLVEHGSEPVRRRRGNSEGDKKTVAPEEKVHLLTELPWRKSGDFSEAKIAGDIEASVPSKPRVIIPTTSPSLPRRYEDSPNFQRERTWSMPIEKKAMFSRRGKQRAKSQDGSPPARGDFLKLPLEFLRPKFSGSVVTEIQIIADTQRSSSPQTPDTPLADCNGFLKVPDSVQRFLGFDINHNSKGLSEEDIRLTSRFTARRGSSSSESSTSTLT